MLTYNYQNRFDRCLHYGGESGSGKGSESTQKGDHVSIQSIKLIGNERIVPHVNDQKVTKWKTYDIEIFPSDHYGLLVDINI